jgi:hypothetical protein
MDDGCAGTMDEQSKRESGKPESRPTPLEARRVDGVVRFITMGSTASYGQSRSVICVYLRASLLQEKLLYFTTASFDEPR